MANHLIWFDEMPEAAGWYWFHGYTQIQQGKPSMLPVCVGDDGTYRANGLFYSAECFNGQWTPAMVSEPHIKWPPITKTAWQWRGGGSWVSVEFNHTDLEFEDGICYAEATFDGEYTLLIWDEDNERWEVN